MFLAATQPLSNLFTTFHCECFDDDSGNCASNRISYRRYVIKHNIQWLIMFISKYLQFYSHEYEDHCPIYRIITEHIFDDVILWNCVPLSCTRLCYCWSCVCLFLFLLLWCSLSLSFSFLPFIRTKWLRTVWLTQPESCLKRYIVTDLVLILHKKKAATLMRNSWSHSGCLCKLRSFLQTKAILSTSPSTTTEKCIALHFI